MTNSAEELHPAPVHHIVNSLGWPRLRPLQEAAIGPVLAGEHVRTGYAADRFSAEKRARHSHFTGPGGIPEPGVRWIGGRRTSVSRTSR